MFGIDKRIARLRAAVAKVETIEPSLEALRASQGAATDLVMTRLDGVERRLADAQVQIAFLVTELDRVNGLYEAAINRSV